ncbi:MAG: Gfo/Idh/MocA family oxidoreductase [Planctomycetota bacterium]
MRIGVCGLGMMGRAHLANALKIDGLEVVALCDIDPTKLDFSQAVTGNIAFEPAQTSLDGVARYEEFDRMLDEAGLDAVIIASPSDQHPPMAVAALEAGLHVFTEKPIAVVPEQGERMCEAARDAGRTLFVGHVVRFLPAYRNLAGWMRDATYGPVVAAEFSRSCGLPGWGGRDWYADPARSGGMPVDLHIHDADFVAHVFGPPPAVRSFRARNERSGADVIDTLYMYKGALVRSHGAWLHRSSGFAAWAVVTFEDATVSYHTGRGDHIDVFRHEGAPDRVTWSPEDGYEAELREFVRCAESGRPSSVCTPESALASLRLVCSEMESAETNEPVRC